MWGKKPIIRFPSGHLPSSVTLTCLWPQTTRLWLSLTSALLGSLYSQTGEHKWSGNGHKSSMTTYAMWFFFFSLPEGLELELLNLISSPASQQIQWRWGIRFAPVLCFSSLTPTELQCTLTKRHSDFCTHNYLLSKPTQNNGNISYWSCSF